MKYLFVQVRHRFERLLFLRYSGTGHLYICDSDMIDALEFTGSQPWLQAHGGKFFNQTYLQN